MVLGAATASAAAVVTLLLGPGGTQPSTAADLATVASVLSGESSPGAPPPGKRQAAVEAAASDYFLAIDGIEGESADAAHRGEIEIHTFSWGVSNPGSARAGSGGGAGKIIFQDFHFTAGFSKASPKLMLKSATGQHIPRAVLTARKAGKGQLEYLKIELTDVLVSSYQSGGSAVVPTDQFSLNFARINVEYRTQRPDGSLSAPVRAEAGDEPGRS